jgi:hypothetical protein
MPVSAVRVRDLEEAEAALFLAAAAEHEVVLPGGSVSREAQRFLFLFAGEVATRRLKTTVGPERLSLARLRAREAALGEDDSRTMLAEYRFECEDLERIVRLFAVPDDVRTNGGHHFPAGEELVLLLLRRMVSADSNTHLAFETGRSESAISEGFNWMMEYLVTRFPDHFTEEAFFMFEHRFADFADGFASLGIPVDNCVMLFDGKLWETCRPTRGQRDCYNGHHKLHGVKGHGNTFPNGILPSAHFNSHGRTHDMTVLRQSGILDHLAEASQRSPAAAADPDWRAGADAGYAPHPHCTPMFPGHTVAALGVLHALFNSDYAPGRVTAEWGFRKIVALWPYVEFAKLKLLRQNVGLILPVGVFLTNIHTCIHGDAISNATGVAPPELEDYLAGNV